MNNSINRNGLSYSEAGKLGHLSSIQKIEEMKQKRIEKYNKVPSICKHCNGSIPYNKRINKFCSHSCSATYNNIKKGKRISNCLFCRTPFYQTRKKKRLCSTKCRDLLRKKKMCEKIESGKYKTKSSTCPHKSPLKQYLLEKRGCKCECCKNMMWLNEPILLTVHHINGDAYDNHLENLQLLCWNCHAITDNYGKKNKNGTRLFREKYY
jgi:hypothetical protein